MTCVVGIRGEHGALVAFDSLASGGSSKTIRRDLKGALLSPEVAFGYTYSYRYGQILEHHLELPEIEGDEHAWTVKAFVPAMRKALSDNGWLKKDSEREQAGQLILAVRNRVFVIHTDHSVEESLDDFIAVGSGADEAQGAIYGVRAAGVDLPDHDEARIGLEAAEHFVTSVAGPWHYIRTTIHSAKNGKAKTPERIAA